VYFWKILLQITIFCDFRSAEDLCKERSEVDSTSQVNDTGKPIPKTTNFTLCHPHLVLLKVCEPKFPVIQYGENSTHCSCIHSFPAIIIRFFLAPKNCPYKQLIIIIDAVFLEVSFYHVNHHKFLVLTFSIPRMIISWEGITKLTLHF